MVEDTSASAALPRIIQGGMGVAVSNWSLARAVAQAGQLGVVSGTAIDTVLVRRLQDGDPGGHMRRAMARFPIPEVAEALAAEFARFLAAPGARALERLVLPLYPTGADAGVFVEAFARHGVAAAVVDADEEGA